MNNVKNLAKLVLLTFLLGNSNAFSADTDNDGLSDAFETLISFDPDVAADVLGDSNLNGFSAWAEFLHTDNGGAGMPTAGIKSWDHESLDDVASYPVVNGEGTLFVVSRDRTLYALNPNGSTLWTYPFDAYVEHAPALAEDGTVYVATGHDLTTNEIRLTAINSAGAHLWDYVANDQISAPPTVSDNGDIYIVTQSGQLIAIGSDGSELWTFTGDSRITHSPAIDADGSLLVATKDKLWRLTTTGIPVWQHGFDGEIAGTPAIAGLGTAIVALKERTVVALDSFKNEVWTFDTFSQTPVGGYFNSSPAINTDGDVIIGDSDGNVYAIDTSGDLKWSSPFVANDAITTAITIGKGGHIYFGTRGRTFYSLDSSGNQRWTYPTEGYIESTPALTDNGVVYVVDKEGKLYALLDQTIGHSPWAMEHKNLRGNSHQCWSPYGYLYFNFDTDGDTINDCQEFQLGIMDLPTPPTGTSSALFKPGETKCYITTGYSSCGVQVEWETSELVLGRLWRNGGSNPGWIDEGTQGTYTVNGVTPSGVTVEVHEGFTQSTALANITVTAGSGNIDAPTTCEIWPGQSTCRILGTWSTQNVTTAKLWKSTDGGISWQPTTSTNGVVDEYIDQSGILFSLHVGTSRGIELDRSSASALLSSWTMGASPNHCEIAAGQTGCQVSLSWSTVNISSVSLWRQDGAGNSWTLFSTQQNGNGVGVAGITGAGVSVEMYAGLSRVGQPFDAAHISATDSDVDGDTVPDSTDNCLTTANASQTDSDSDGIGDACDVNNDDDNDGEPNDSDNCPSIANANQLNTDNDFYGDVCDSDDDNDTFADALEVTCNTDPLDAQSMPSGACLGADTDGDGTVDADDVFPTDPTETTDTDGDGIGNNADMDDDGDKVPDDADATPTAAGSSFDGFTPLRPGITSPVSAPSIRVPGPTPYTAGVDSDGIGKISIPLKMVPGINGLQPSLSLEFDSGRMAYQEERNMTQGVLGYGWFLSGLSRIQRCEPIAAGVQKIAFTTTDELCLDGERLVPVNSSTKWATGAEYRTERDVFARIIGDAANGFTVETYDGRTLHYGKTASSRVSARGTAVDYLWMLDKEEDEYQQAISYSYYKDDTAGEIYPHKIEYILDGTVNDAAVTFYYDKRADEETTKVQVGDHFATSSVYLHRVGIETKNKAVRDYHLTHRTGAHQDEIAFPHSLIRRLLVGLQECGFKEDGSSGACLNPISFGWDEQTTYLAVDRLTDSLGAETVFSYADYDVDQDPQTTNLHRLPITTEDTTQIDLLGTSCTTGKSHFQQNEFHFNRRAYVKEMQTNNGLAVGGVSSVNVYRYRSAGTPTYVGSNRGYAGHKRVVEENLSLASDPVTSFTRRELCFPRVGLIAARHEYDDDLSGNPTIARVKTETDWQVESLHSGATSFVYAATTVAQSFESGSDFGVLKVDTSYNMGTVSHLPTTVTTTEQKAASISKIGGSWSISPVLNQIQTVAEYKEEGSGQTHWIDGFIEKVTTTYSDPQSTNPAIVQVTEFENVDHKMVLDKVEEPRGGIKVLVSDFVYDARGNTTKVSQYDSTDSSKKRETTLGDYADFRFPKQVTNPEGEVVNYTYDPRFGTPNYMKSPDGRQSIIGRDQFGRVIKVEDTTNNNDHEINVSFAGNQGEIVFDHPQAYWALIENSKAPNTKLFFDVLGRQVSQAQRDLSNQWVYQDVGFDSRGRVVKQSLPYASALDIGESDHPIRHVTAYDKRDRLVTRTNADSGSTTVTYQKVLGELEIQTTESVKFESAVDGTVVSKQYLDAIGRLTRSVDPNSTDSTTTEVVFSYDAMGSLLTSQVESNDPTVITYDNVGQRLTINEPHTGLTEFIYTVYGQLDRQTKNMDRVIKFDYDDVGRLIERVDDYQLAINDPKKIINKWKYGTVNEEVGRLIEETQDIGVDGSNEFLRVTGYDQKSGGPSSITTTIAVTGLPVQTIDVAHAYDAQGRLLDSTLDGVTTNNIYDGTGHLKSRMHNGTALQTIDTTDAFGNATQVTLGNGLITKRTFDPTSGRLNSIETGNGRIQNLSYKWRTDGALKKREEGSNTETFVYDNLRRLVSATTNNTASRALIYEYNNLGNLLSKTSSVATDLNVIDYNYGGTTQPNALKDAKIGLHVVDLAYDNGGNVTSISSANPDGSSNTDARTFEYNTHNLVTNIEVEDKYGVFIASEDFLYGPDQKRYMRKSMWDDNGVSNETYTFYGAGGKIERVYTPSLSEYNTKIQLSSNVTYKKETNRIFYIHRDQLGSIHKMSDENGFSQFTLAFDPFGGRRSPDWSAVAEQSQYFSHLELLTSLSQRGFTGHEPLDRTGVIHMNGRIYDPLLGRFLNADPIVQAPTNTQSHNRYSYVFNNPLSLRDPSGFMSKSDSDDEDFDEPPVVSPPGGFIELFDINQNRQTYGVQFFNSAISIVGGSVRDIVDVHNRFYEAVAVGLSDVTLHDVGLAVWPGYDLGTCVDTGECSGAEWGLATVGVIPGGKAVAGGGKILIGIGGVVVLKGGKVAKGAVNPKSVKQFGHTFNTHGAGAKNTRKLQGRAAGTGQSQGQFLDNQKAADFLSQHSGLTKAADVNLPSGLGQIIRPDGSISAATKVRIVPNGKGGLRSAFPVD